MMDCSKSRDGHQLEPETKKKIKSERRAEDIEDDLPEGPQLGVDELCLIFENSWNSARDLLSFRMVNKNWRDAATTTLLKRNACSINLKLNNNKDPSTGQLPIFHKLGQLTELISNSPKFPTTKFSIHSSSTVDYSSLCDLLPFFERHRDQIRTLCPIGLTTQKLLNDILFKFTPSLQCLDLSYARFRSSKKGRNKSLHSNISQSMSQVLPITSLWLGVSWKDNYYPDSVPDEDPKCKDNRSNATEYHIVHWLLSSPSKLTCIKNVTVDTLGGVLREGKGHLIQSFTYSLSKSYSTNSEQTMAQRVTSPVEKIMTRFLALKPMLTTVTLDMQYEADDLEFTADITLVNALIDSIKHTVQNLTFCFDYESHNWTSKVKIPPMKNLKWITVEDSSRQIDSFDPFDLHVNFIQFDDGISAQNYFPCLKKISLRYQGGCWYLQENTANLMSFFAFKSGRDDGGSVWDSLPNVDTLETHWEVITGLYCTEDAPENTLLPEMFPNIRILKLKCDDLFDLKNRCWILCPKVEFMEIYNIQDFTQDFEAVACNLSHRVDKFFTGFPLEICEKLKTKKLPNEKNNPEMLDFLQVLPSIRQLKHLKELKLQFVASFSTEFASAAVTGENAFAKMPNTKFIFLYNSKIFRRIKDQTGKRKKITVLDAKAAVAAEEVCFGSMQPYVQIVHE